MQTILDTPETVIQKRLEKHHRLTNTKPFLIELLCHTSFAKEIKVAILPNETLNNNNPKLYSVGPVSFCEDDPSFPEEAWEAQMICCLAMAL